MTPAERYKLDSVDPKAVLDSPEAFEIVDALLELYRTKCRSEQRQQETIQSLLDRLYGRKSEKSKYHPDQKLLLQVPVPPAALPPGDEDAQGRGHHPIETDRLGLDPSDGRATRTALGVNASEAADAKTSGGGRDNGSDGRPPAAGQPNRDDLSLAVFRFRRRRRAVHGVRLCADARTRRRTRFSAISTASC